ncbi:MAG: DUF4198 domain-containing protein [Phycisphaerales bacterium]
MNSVLKAVAMACLAACVSARGQAIPWLEPFGGDGPVRFRVVVDGPRGVEAVPARAASWYFERTEEAQINAPEVPSEVPGADGQTGVRTSSLRGPGIIGVDFKPEETEEPAARARELAGAAIRDRIPEQGTVRVRRVHSMKLVIGGGAAATSKAAQAVELQPMADPAGASVGSDLPLRTLVDGAKAGGVEVEARRVADEAKPRGLTSSADGIVNLRIDAEGLWLITMRRASLEADGTLVVRTASLVVHLGGGR